MAGLLVLPGMGCENKAKDFQIPAPAVEPAPEPLDTTLSVGDVLEVTYFKRYQTEGPYKIGISDTLRLVIENRPELNSEAVVLPDGTCIFPKLGAVPVSGRTVAEVASDLTERYGKYLDSPQLDVLIPKPRGRVEDFFDVLGISTSGPLRRTVVKDGVIDLPLIQPVSVLDRTIGDVRHEIEGAYAEVLPEVQVTVSIASASPRSISVVGEVERGGVFEIPGRITLMRAVAYAGGFTDRAYLAQVLHVHPEENGALKVDVLDLEQLAKGQESALWLAHVSPNDVIYVPRSPIGDIDVFVDQYLRKLIPISIGVGIPIYP